MEQPDIDDHLSRDARERLQQTLAPGETLLWAAAPIPRLHLRRHGSDLFSGLLCLALAFACAGKAGLFSAEETRMTLSGGIFISIVLTFILLPCLSYLSRPWIEYWRRRNMIAAVTDRRCLLLYPRLFRSPGLGEWPLRYSSVDEQPDGSGDIIFITPAHTRRPGTIGPKSFPDIPCVRRVQHIIDNAALAAAPSPEPDDDSDAPGLPAPTPWRHLIAGTIALLIAAGVSIIVYLTARSSYRIVRDYLPATATVTHVEWIERESGRGGSRVARVLYRFTLDGQSYTGRKEGATIGVEEVGERIDILYNPDNPAENSSSRFFDLWFIPVLFGGFLLLTASLSTYSFITLFKELRKAPPRLNLLPPRPRCAPTPQPARRAGHNPGRNTRPPPAHRPSPPAAEQPINAQEPGHQRPRGLTHSPDSARPSRAATPQARTANLNCKTKCDKEEITFHADLFMP